MLHPKDQLFELFPLVLAFALEHLWGTTQRLILRVLQPY